MHKKFEIIRTKIKGGSQSERKVVTHSDLPLSSYSKKKELHIIQGALFLNGIFEVTLHSIIEANHS